MDIVSGFSHILPAGKFGAKLKVVEPEPAKDTTTNPGFPEYYLQVVRSGEEPKWPKPVEDLIVGHQPLTLSFTQYWAYPKESNKSEQELPHAEELAAKNLTPRPAVLIDQIDSNLELILVKDGHAWAKTESSVVNLEDNLSSLLHIAHNQLEVSVEHFMTTERVSAEVEKKLDDLEEASDGGVKSDSKESPEPVAAEEQVVSSPRVNIPPAGASSYAGQGYSLDQSSKSSKLVFVIPILVLAVAFLGVVGSDKDLSGKISRKLGSLPLLSTPTPTPTVTPTPSPSPTPTPSVERSKYKVRVLNGTTRTGAAATLSQKLSDLGWQILSTGNAGNQNYDQTQVMSKGEQGDATSVLVNDLGSDYQASISSQLKPTDKADLQVIIGKK